jgi:hypothetical protein
MPAYAEGGVSAHLNAAAIDNNRQRLRARTRRLSRVAISRCLRSSSRVQPRRASRRAWAGAAGAHDFRCPCHSFTDVVARSERDG